MTFCLCVGFWPAAHAAQAAIPLIIDSDANNELDDQHAIAYVALNPDVFDLLGVTVNRTRNGGGVDKHVEEAIRVLELCGRYPEVPVVTGADGTYDEIRPDLGRLLYDGSAAVDFIIREARKPRDQKLVLAPIGKLTNVALALVKAPDIIDRVRIVWLGSNYPEQGEYNLVNDTSAVNPVVDSGVELEWAVVRYGEPSGTDAVRISRNEVRDLLTGLGPRVEAVPGRDGGSFKTFGDYAVDLFANIEMYGDPPSRALFDMAALAVLKNPGWAERRTIRAPRLVDENWVEHADRERRIVLWEHFDRDAIIADFIASLR